MFPMNTMIAQAVADQYTQERMGQAANERSLRQGRRVRRALKEESEAVSVRKGKTAGMPGMAAAQRGWGLVMSLLLPATLK